MSKSYKRQLEKSDDALAVSGFVSKGSTFHANQTLTHLFKTGEMYMSMDDEEIDAYEAKNASVEENFDNDALAVDGFEGNNLRTHVGLTELFESGDLPSHEEFSEEEMNLDDFLYGTSDIDCDKHMFKVEYLKEIYELTMKNIKSKNISAFAGDYYLAKADSGYSLKVNKVGYTGLLLDVESNCSTIFRDEFDNNENYVIYIPLEYGVGKDLCYNVDWYHTFVNEL